MKSRKVDGLRLRELRELRGLTGAALAEKVAEKLQRAISKHTIWKIETGEREPSGEVFIALCAVLDVDGDDLLLERGAA